MCLYSLCQLGQSHLSLFFIHMQKGGKVLLECERERERVKKMQPIQKFFSPSINTSMYIYIYIYIYVRHQGGGWERPVGVLDEFDWMEGHSRGKYMIEKWESMGGKVKRFNSSLDMGHHHHFYKGCFNKFLSLTLNEYSRIIYMDADRVPLHNMDHLFHLEFPANVIAAYWLGKKWHHKDKSQELLW